MILLLIFIFMLRNMISLHVNTIINFKPAS